MGSGLNFAHTLRHGKARAEQSHSVVRYRIAGGVAGMSVCVCVLLLLVDASLNWVGDLCEFGNERVWT